MKTSPLAAVYVTILLAMAVAAWADGCVTSYPAVPVKANSGQIYTPPYNTLQEECLDINCDATPYSAYPPVCSSSTCQDGTCQLPVNNQYCTGKPSPWTQQVETLSSQREWCFEESPQDGGCTPMGAAYFETAYFCNQGGTQPGQPLCMATWYNAPDCE
jgi:hypothetical protein